MLAFPLSVGISLNGLCLPDSCPAVTVPRPLWGDFWGLVVTVPRSLWGDFSDSSDVTSLLKMETAYLMYITIIYKLGEHSGDCIRVCRDKAHARASVGWVCWSPSPETRRHTTGRPLFSSTSQPASAQVLCTWVLVFWFYNNIHFSITEKKMSPFGHAL